MEKCARLENLLMNQPDKLDFTVLDCGNVRIAGLDDLFTMDEMNRMLTSKLKIANSEAVLEELKMQKHAAIEVPKEAIPIRKEAENTAVIIDMYEVDYLPTAVNRTTEAINKNFDQMRDFVSRMTFPETTIPDIIVGPKEEVFKKHVHDVQGQGESPELAGKGGPPVPKQSIWKSIWRKLAADDTYDPREDYYKPESERRQQPKVLYQTHIPEGLLSPNGEFYPVKSKGYGAHNMLAVDLLPTALPEDAQFFGPLLSVADKGNRDYKVGISLVALNALLKHGWVRVNDATDAHADAEQGQGIGFSGFDTGHVASVAKSWLTEKQGKYNEVLLDVFSHDVSAEGTWEFNNIVKSYGDITRTSMPVGTLLWLKQQTFEYEPTVAFRGTQDEFMSKFGRRATAGVADLISKIEEGLEDETQGGNFWEETARALHDLGMLEESRIAESFANQEATHHKFLETLKAKTTTAQPEMEVQEQNEPVLHYMKRYYDMMPTDLIRSVREKFKISDKEAWRLYEATKQKLGPRKGSQRKWADLAQQAPAMGQAPAPGVTPQSTDPAQEAGQFGRQPDGTFRYTYQDSAVLVNPDQNTMIVNTWVRGQDNQSVQLGINRASAVAMNAVQYYARTIQMPTRLVNRMRHTLQGNYISVPFTIATTQLQQTTSWKSMSGLE